jgi:ATP-binding cassette subfamily B protein/subfamily B ATP-binding cassette protein MsbA
MYPPAPDASVWRLCRWSLGYAFARWPALLAVLATMLLQVGLGVLQPWPMKVLVDSVLDDQPLPATLRRAVDLLPGAPTPHNLLAWTVAATVVLFLLGWGLGVVAAYANIWLGQRMVYDLAADLFAHLQRLSLRYHTRRPVGDTIRRVTEDSGCVSTIVKDALLPVLTSLVSLATMFLIMWRLDAGLTILALAALPLMVIALRRYAGPMADRSYEQQEAEGGIYTVVEETLSAIPVVQAFGREEAADHRFRASTHGTLTATLAATRVQFKFKILTGLSTAAGTAAILWLGANRVLDGHLTVGEVLVFLSYLGSLYGPLESIVYTSSTVQDAAGSARRVLEVLRTTPDVVDRTAAVPLARTRGDVRFQGVSFGYEPDRPVLRGVDLAVRAGETVAVVGATGAGKSTLIGLVPRFFDPWTGRVCLDGRDVRDVRLADLRSQIALVLQEPFLFPLSGAENIAYGRPGASRAEIEAAAQAASAHDFIARLPDGYDTVIGERGATLSGGQRQRLAIARALLKDAPILILDEPTSALDAETEAELLSALERLAAGRTTLIIAHRLSTIRHADRIVVLRDGAVAEEGSHAELLARGELYARLHDLQHGEPAHVPIEGTR